MNGKKNLGIALLVIGIALMFGSQYIMGQVNEGKEKIAKGQKVIDQGNSLFSLNPTTKEIGKGVTGSAQKKIDEGNVLVGEYATMAGKLKMGGIGLALLGALFLFLGMKKRSR